jgi:multidrug efflux pump subunit AcrB
VSIRFSGLSLDKLREVAEKAKAILRAQPESDRVRDDWGAESFAIRLKTDPDRANLSGVTNLDVALSSIAGTSGLPLTSLREGDKQIPVILRLRAEERARVDDVQNLYVFSAQGDKRVPLRQVSTIEHVMQPEKIRRRNHFRTVTVSAFPLADVLPSTLLSKARPALGQLATTLPPGYWMEIGGEEEAQIKGFNQLWAVLIISVVLIYLALVFEFKSAVKPFIVFAAIPFGMVGALASLQAVRAPFGFMAFLGIASLIGVIVSHVIVLFDFIEDAHEDGKPLREALVEAGIVRLRPVLITVGATVLGLIPLAVHGGPLWEPMCFAQIGGLLVATVITLLLVPVLYAIFVLDLKIVGWHERDGAQVVPLAEGLPARENETERAAGE